MPGSVRENDEFVRAFVATQEISTVLDVGAGQGTYADMLKDRVSIIDGIEVWTDYVTEYALESKYRKVIIEDVRTLFAGRTEAVEKEYDLVVFGDILEHMSEEESLTVWQQAGNLARWGLISVPIIHYPQGAEGGNPYEVHVQDHLTPEKVREMFGPFEFEAMYNITGTFIKRF